MNETIAIIIGSFLSLCVLFASIAYSQTHKDECKIMLQNDAHSLPIYREFINPTQLKRN